MIRWQNYLKILLIISLFSLVAALAAFEINDPDTLQYLVAGKYILEHGFAKTNIFSFTIPDQPLVWTEWLFEILVYVAYSIGQWKALVSLQILLAVSIFLVIFLIGRHQGYKILAWAPFFILAALIGAERFMLRADLLAALLAILSFYFLLIDQKKDSKLIYLLPVLTLIWANVHGSFPLAYLLVGSFILSPLINHLWQKYVWHQSIMVVDGKIKRLSFIFLLCLVASLINPSGWSAIVWPFKTMFSDMSFLSEYNQEFRPTLKSGDFQRFSVGYYQILVWLIVAMVIISWRNWRLLHLLLLIPLLYLSLRSVRHIAMFSFFAASIMPTYLDLTAAKMRVSFLTAKIREWLGVAALVGLIVINGYLIWAVVTNDYYVQDQRTRRFGFDLTELVFPVGAAEFIKENNIAGHGFNNYGIGTYLNWRLFPQKLTFIDGHTAPPDFFKEYLRIMRGEVSYNEVAAEYQINYFILNHTNSDTLKLISQLMQDTNWALVYFDELSVVLLNRQNQLNQTIIAQNETDFQTSKNFDPQRLKVVKRTTSLSTARGYRGTFFERLGYGEQAINEFQEAIKSNSRNYVAHYNLGTIYRRLNKLDEAKKEFEEAIKIMPRYALPHLGLAQIYQKREDYDRAAGEYQRVLKINKKQAGANYGLGIIREIKGSYKEAILAYEREIANNPNFAPPYFNLGVIYLSKLIDKNKAVIYWQRYLELKPDDPQAEAIKKELQKLQGITR